jgi:hypothetical protein
VDEREKDRRKTTMYIWLALLTVCGAGAVGGLVNALLTDNGFFLPREEKSDHMAILRPGFLGNILIGMVAALSSWGFYSSFASVEVFQPLPASASFTLANVVGAMLVGMGGARWLTNEIDKRLLRAAAVTAASAPAAPAAAQDMAAASPASVLTIAQRIPSTT